MRLGTNCASPAAPARKVLKSQQRSPGLISSCLYLRGHNGKMLARPSVLPLFPGGTIWAGRPLNSCGCGVHVSFPPTGMKCGNLMMPPMGLLVKPTRGQWNSSGSWQLSRLASGSSGSTSWGLRAMITLPSRRPEPVYGASGRVRAAPSCNANEGGCIGSQTDPTCEQHPQANQ